MPRLVTLLALGLLSLSGLPAARVSSPSPGNTATSTDSAMATVLAAFRTHPIVILGMDHRLLSEMVFARALVTSSAFPAVANDVVIECANARYQALLDSYIAGDDVPLKELSVVWRNSTQTGRCDGADGPTLLAAIRERNRVLPPNQRIRVLAPDPRIDWDHVQSPTDPMNSLEYVSPPSYTADDSTYLREVDRRRTVSGEGSAPVASVAPAPGNSSVPEPAAAPAGARSLASPCIPAGRVPRRPDRDSPPRRIPSSANLNDDVARPSLN